ncbi:MAG: DUF2490 domain-containing protein [Bacteroidaceae bacterium]|nr:DUF2490 domain-containing protein [Bacteroidaceae bacterium]
MKRFGVVCLVLLVAHQVWADDNTGGVWTEVGVSKALPYNLSAEASAEYRTIDWFDWSSRWNVGAGLTYKLGKNFRFGLGYTFIQKHNQEEWKNHYGSNSGKWNGYNVDAPNWANRHRLSFDVVGTKKFRKVLRISLRERYQYTYQAPRDVDRMKLRDPSYDGEGNLTSLDDTTYTVDRKSAKNRHLLRSRLKLSIDKKGWKWEPYISVEAHNNLGDKMHLDKVRTAVGVDYSIKKSHKVGLGYIFNHENDDDGDQNIHAISVGYSYKF